MQNSAVVFRQPTYFLKPVSLGACEAELRSMTSCLCDGTYLRRCIQFVTNVQIEDPPPAKKQQLDELPHVPYQPWCAPCVCSRACSDKPERSSAGTRPSTLCIRFGFGYTKSRRTEDDSKKISNYQFGAGRFCQWISPHHAIAQ